MSLSKRVVMVLACIMALALMAGPLYAGHGGKHWSYEGEEGPAHWGEISTDYELCKAGMHQSPIDLTDAEEADLGEITFDYNVSPLKVINNGHAIQVNYAPGSSITIDGKKYELLQFHFHSPSENTMDGEPFDMEAHLVHKAADGQLAVIGVFIEKGRENSFLAPIWKNIPSEIGKEKSVDSVKINAMDLLPDDDAFFRFTGSLTTPPCSEDVIWTVMEDSIQLSKSQLEQFRKFYSNNARPVQPLNDRELKITE